MTLKSALLLSVTFFVMLKEIESLKCLNGTNIKQAGKQTANVPEKSSDCKSGIVTCSFIFTDQAAPGLTQQVVVQSCSEDEADKNETCTKAPTATGKRFNIPDIGGGSGIGGGLKNDVSIATCLKDNCNTYEFYNKICNGSLVNPNGQLPIRPENVNLAFVSLLGLGLGAMMILQKSP